MEGTGVMDRRSDKTGGAGRAGDVRQTLFRGEGQIMNEAAAFQRFLEAKGVRADDVDLDDVLQTAKERQALTNGDGGRRRDLIKALVKVAVEATAEPADVPSSDEKGLAFDTVQ